MMASMFLLHHSDIHNHFLIPTLSGTPAKSGRHLLAALNCTPRAIDEYPGDFFSDEVKEQGGVVVHFLITFYLFSALAIVCDDYFVPSLEQISDSKYRL